MAVSIHLLLLLVPVLSFCGATQYYVTPTEPTNTSCHAQPCFTLNHYTNHSDRYFKSNTVFKFLPGMHLMNRPLEIRDVENISLEAINDKSDKYPQLVAQFTCQYEADSTCIHIHIYKSFHMQHAYCSALRMINVTNATIEGIIVATKAPNVSAFILQQCSDLHIQSISYSNIQDNDTDDLVRNASEFGILIYESSEVEIDTMDASNFSIGVILHKSNNTILVNVSTTHNENHGVYLYRSTGTTMMNVSVAHNVNNGIYLYYSTNTSMMNVSAAHNQNDGIYLHHSTDISMMNVFAAQNMNSGIYLHRSTETSMMNVFAAHNENDGIYLHHSTDISMKNVFAVQNMNSGIYSHRSTETSMMNVSGAHNENDGIYLYHSADTSMMNVSAVHNENDGIYLYHSADTNMMNAFAAQNVNGGIHLYNCTDTTMMTVSAAHNKYNGIYLYDSTNTSMMNVSAVNNEYDGIRLNYSTYTDMTNVSAAHNVNNGIFVYYSTNTSMMNVSIAHNKYNGMKSNYSNYINMTNMSAAYNEYNGIWLYYCTYTVLVNASAANNKYSGIVLHYSTNTSMMNVTAAYNEYDGIFLYYSVLTSMMNVSVGHNEAVGVSLEQSTNTYILKTVVNENGHIEILNTANTYITNTTSLITAYNATNIVLNDSSFINMDFPSTASSTSEPINLPAVITLYDSTLTIIDCTFTRNKFSSIKTINSNVTMSGKILFINNTASSGTVLISAKTSILITTDYSNVQFQNNHAINYGGVFYINAEESYGRSVSLQDIIQSKEGGSLITSRTGCFVHVEGIRSHARFTFINNTAGRGGDVLYGGLVALGYDGDWNCLLSFKNTSDMSQQSSLSFISSAPSRVCLCNESGYPDCLTVADATPRVIYPGQSITIPAVVVGQDFGTVNSSVFAQFNHTPYTTDSVDMEPRHSIAVEHSHCSNLEYTMFSQSEDFEAVLVLTQNNREISHPMNKEDNTEITNSWERLNKEPNYKILAQDIICDFIEFNLNPEFTIRYNESSQPGNRTIQNFYKFTAPITMNLYSELKDHCKRSIQAKFVFPKEIYSYPVYINISFRPCPPGFSLSKHPPFRCDCNQLMQHLPGVKCHIQDQTISRSGEVWITTDGNETLATSNCPYNYCNRKKLNVTLKDPDSQCNFNHSGTLCGGCQPSLSIALGTNHCLHCHNTHLALLLPFALAGVVLVCFIKVMDLTISQGTLNGLIFYANVVKANEYLLFDRTQTNPLAVFIAWLNLDLGVETCFFDGLTAYWRTWLQFVFPLYIWSIASLIIILAKYSDRVAKIMGNNSVPVLATLFLLSYAKLFRTIITSLSFTMLYTTHGSKAVWSADGNLDYLGREHAPLFVVAAATLLFLWLPYTLLLFLGQWLHWCNCRLITRMMMKIKPFLDAHYGPLKGNHRYWFGALLLVKAVILLISALIPQDRTIITLYSITICTLVLTGFSVGVYKSFAAATFNAVWFVNLGVLSISHMFTTFEGGNFSLALNCFFGLAFAQFIGLILFKVLVIIKCSKRVMSYLHRGQPADDDWELYEQAALQREMESDDEGEESEESGSIESLPTYGF